MKIAITAHGVDCHATVDTRFSRTDYFVLYDQECGVWDFLPNTQNCKPAHGSRKQSEQVLVNTGTNVLLTGYIGPKAFRMLQAQRIDIYSLGDLTGSVAEALEAFHSGKLTPINSPNALDLKK